MDNRHDCTKDAILEETLDDQRYGLADHPQIYASELGQGVSNFGFISEGYETCQQHIEGGQCWSNTGASSNSHASCSMGSKS